MANDLTVLDPVDDVVLFVDALVAAMFGNIEALLSETATFGNNVEADVRDNVAAQFKIASDGMGDILDDVTKGFSTTVDDITDYIESNYNLIETNIDDIASGSLEFIGGVAHDVSSSLTELQTDAGDFLTQFYDSASEELIGITGNVTTYLSDTGTQISDFVSDLYNDVELGVQDTYRVVTNGINEGILTASETWDAINNDIGGFIGDFLDPIEGTIVGLLETVSDLPSALSDLSLGLVESAKENISNPLTALPNKLTEAIGKSITDLVKGDDSGMSDSALAMIFGQSPVPRDMGTFRQLADAFFNKSGPLSSLMTALVSPMILLQVLGGISSANSQILLQEHAITNPYRLLDPAELILAKRFKAITDEDAFKISQKWGFEQQDIEVKKIIAEELPPAGEALSWWLREIITEEELQLTLEKLGYSLESISNLKQAALYVPNVSDLILMAVRDVFSPEIAEAFGQYEDYPEELTQFARDQGLSEDWARRYWAAHWKLPSIQMAFDMLHRGIINEQDIQRLLKAQDVMPFWRDKITQLSYSPLTRVDVRRMHALGVLSLDEVKKAYKDLGYNEENAKRLADFVEQYNGVDDSEAAKEAEGLTRSSILSFYEDGIINYNEAFSLLSITNISETVAEMYLTSIDFDAERKERDAEKKLVSAKFKAGNISYDQANDELTRLGFEGVELNRVLIDLQTEEAKATKLPTKAELDKMLKGKIITKDEYKETMSRLGYSSLWTDRFIKLAHEGDENG